MPRQTSLDRSLIYCFAAGVALSFTLPKLGLCFLAWFLPAVLFYFVRRAPSWKAGALRGFLFGFGFGGGTLFWVYHTCRFAGVPIPISILAITALAGVLAISWGIFGAAVWVSAKKIPLAALPWVWAVLWVAVESAGARWTPRFAFDVLTYTQWKWLPLIQVGAIFGPHGLSFVIMAWNGALAELGGKGNSRWLRHNLSAAGILILLTAVYGTAVLARRPSPKLIGDSSKIEILQPNIDQYRKWDSRFEDDIREALNSLLLRPRAAKPALILWPESALPGWLDEIENHSWISGWARKLDAPMLVGTVARAGDKRHNSAVWVDPDGAPVGLYHKRELVPFGEFVPFRKWLQPWIGILAQMGEFTPGKLDSKLFDTAFGKVAVTICYEAVFPRYGVFDAGRGARVFINLTNDGWYKNTAAPYQHFTINIFRAIENRATVIRAANTGISGMIDPWGAVIAKTSIAQRVRLDLPLPENPFPEGSFYSRHGDWFGALALLLSLLLGAAGLGPWRQRK